MLCRQAGQHVTIVVWAVHCAGHFGRAPIGGVVGVCMVQCFVIALEVLDNLPHDKVMWVPKPQAQALEGTQAQPQGWELHEAIVRCAKHVPS